MTGVDDGRGSFVQDVVHPTTEDDGKCGHEAARTSSTDVGRPVASSAGAGTACDWLG
jgi:hypothetical protein